MNGQKDKVIKYSKRTVLVLAMLVIAILFLMPMCWIFSTSLRMAKDSFTLPPHFLPTQFSWDNYKRVFEIIPFDRFMVNSLIVTISGTVLQITVSSLAAYAFARIEFPGKNLLFVLFLSGIMIPAQATAIPKFLMLRKLGLLNTLYALIIPAIIDPLAIFLLRQNMMTIPKSYDESALMDGASRFRIYWNIIMPMCKSSVVVVVVTRALVLWNDFFQPLIYVSEYKNMTIPLGITVLRSVANYGTGSVAIILAGVSMGMIPPLLLYIFCQKQLMGSSVLSGLKS